MSDKLSAVAAAHEVLGALLHTVVATDGQASPEGFRRARELGLLADSPNPRSTNVGRAVLRALGVASEREEKR